MIHYMDISVATTITMATLDILKDPVDSKKEHIGMEKRQARDGIGSALHDLADCETLRNSLFTPMTYFYLVCVQYNYTCVNSLYIHFIKAKICHRCEEDVSEGLTIG